MHDINSIIKHIIAILLALVTLLLPLDLLIYCPITHTILNKSFSNIQNNDMLYGVIDFFKGRAELDGSFFSEQALIHMHDARNLIINLEIFLAITMVACALLYLIFVKQRANNLNSILRSSGRYSLAMIIVLVFTMAFFSKSFEVFHHLFFTNNLWLFPPQDTLVNLYTQDFFLWFSITWLAISAAISLILINIDKFINISPLNK